MSDLIDRQAAIDALAEALNPHLVKFVRAKNAIEQLPSAQPEIVRCKDCDWWTKQEDSLQGRCALMGMYPTGGWFCGNARKRKVTE